MTESSYDINRNIDDKSTEDCDKFINNEPFDESLPIPKLSFRNAAIIVGLLSLIPYWNTQYADLTFDDNPAIVNNDDILPKTPLTNIFRNDFWGTKMTSNTSHKSYRPLTVLTYRWSYYMANRLDPWNFHIVNIVLHVVNSILILRLFAVLFSSQSKCNDYEVSKASFLSGVLFAVHPIHTESVAATVGRADLLCTLFFILAFLCYVHSARPENGGILYFIMSILFSMIALFCKEQGITVLGVCLVYDLVFISNINIESIKFGFQLNKKTLRRGALLVIFGLAFVLLRLNIMGGKLPPFQEQDNPASFHPSFTFRVINYFYIYALNIWILLSPWWLCFDWAMGCITLINSFTDYRLVAPIVFSLTTLCVVVKAITISHLHIGRVLIMSLAFLVIPFIPAMNIFFRVGFVIAERNLYIPSIGFIMLVVFGITIVSKVSKQLTKLFVYLLTLLFIVRCMDRCYDWMTEEQLFNDGVNVCPNNAKVHYNIGKMHHDGKRTDEAIQSYLEAIRLYPRYDQPMNNVANIYKEMGMKLEAEYHLQNAVNITPTFAAAWMNLGGVKADLKKKQEAIMCYKNAVTHRKNYPDTYYNWGNLHLEYNEFNEAYEKFKIAIALKQDHMNSWQNVIILLGKINNAKELKLMSDKALRLFPNDGNLISIIGSSFTTVGDLNTAETLFKKSIQLSPNSSSAFGNLAVIYHRWKRYEEALKLYEKSLQLEPSQDMQENYAKLKRILARQQKRP